MVEYRLSPKQKEKLLRNIEQDASFNEIHYYGCAQSTMAALQKYLRIGDLDTFKAASALGGGASGMGEVCGAVVAGIMAIGLVYGREKFDEKANAHHDPVYLECRKRGRYLCEKFRREFGYLTCRDIKYKMRGIYLFEPSKAEPTAQDWANQDKNHDKCGEVCGKAARLAAEAIIEPTITLP